MTKQLSPEQLALSSYIKYTAYIINALARELSKEEYSKLMESYIGGVPVNEAVSKLNNN